MPECERLKMNALNCNCETPLGFKGLTAAVLNMGVVSNSVDAFCWFTLTTAVKLSNILRLYLHLPGSEQGTGRWVMGHGSNGSRKSDGSHGSWVTRC